jgi:biotin carboxyl carrier protein
MSKKKLKNLKAPMPGLVVKIAAKPGDTIPKGGALLVLEAMKMENIIKSPDDVVVKSILVNQGDAVEKNEVLVNFED